MNPQLSHYTQFYIVIYNLYKSGQITHNQKQFLKQRLQKKDQAIQKILVENSGPGKQKKKKQKYDYLFRENQLREKFIKYLQENFSLGGQTIRRGHKSKTVHFEIRAQNVVIEQCPASIRRGSRRSEENDCKIQSLPGSASLICQQLQAVLQHHIDSNGYINCEEHVHLRHLRDQLNILLNEPFEIESLTPLRATLSSKQDDSQKDKIQSPGPDSIIQMKREIEQQYHELKKLFLGSLHTHMLLMQEDITYLNIYGVLKYLVKEIVDSDEFTFLLCRDNEWGVYSTQNDTVKSLIEPCDQKERLLKDLNQEIGYIKPNYVHSLSCKQNPYPQVCSVSKILSFQSNYLIKFRNEKEEVVFIFHWSNKNKINIRRRFLKCANEFQFTQNIIELCSFLVDTIITARIQYFSPLRFADKIQDLTNSFMGISRYLFVDGIKRVLKKQFEIEMEKIKSNGESQRDSFYGVRLELKDVNPVTLIVKNLNLKQEQQLDLWTLILKLQERYDGYVNLCQEKSAFYKYFLRTGDSLLFDFNRKGELTFLSRPINEQLKQIYSLTFDPQVMGDQKIKFSDIFKDNSLLPLLNIRLENWNSFQNQYLSEGNSQFELFFRVVSNQLKGFSIILHENKEKRLRQQFQTLRMDSENLANELENQIKKTYTKQQTFKFLHQIEYTNKVDVRNSMISLFIPEQELASLRLNQNNNSPDNLSIKYDFDDKISSKQGSPTSSKGGNRILFKVPSCGIINPSQFKANEDDDSLDTFEFNIFKYETTEDKQHVVWAILNRNEFINSYKINLTILAQFLQELERKYNKRKNPFHNYDHGVSVMQSTHFICSRQKIKGLISKLTTMATIISGLCHDVGHTARTNIFEINSRSKLALRYHDQSPLEQHHAATTMFLLREKNKNFLSSLSKEDFTKFRQVLIDNILYTDIKVHFNLLNSFENRYKDSLNPGSKPYGQGDDDLKLLTGMIIHTADFNGGAKEFKLSRKWSERVNKEFMAQYIEEGKLQIPQTPFLKDLDNICVMAKSEMNFFKFIVRPVWVSLNTFTNNQIIEAVNNLDNTIIQWEQIHLNGEVEDTQNSLLQD